MACSEKSSIPTSKDDSLVDLSIFERNSVFLVPSLTNFMPRFALATPRFARSPQVGFALHEILRSGTKKTEFPPQKNKSPSFSSLLVGKGLFATAARYSQTSAFIPTNVRTQRSCYRI